MQLFSKLAEDILTEYRNQKINSPNPKYQPKLTIFIDCKFLDDLLIELNNSYNVVCSNEVNTNNNTILGFKFYKVIDFNQPYKIVVN